MRVWNNSKTNITKKETIKLHLKKLIVKSHFSISLRNTELWIFLFCSLSTGLFHSAYNYKR